MTSCALAQARLNFHKADTQILLRFRIGHQKPEASRCFFLSERKGKKSLVPSHTLVTPQDQGYSPCSLAYESDPFLEDQHGE